ncbi:LGFP repeat-containing protein [Williamsia maris]|uniref:LGFP repeat-containing protein n=1 Tax=Williamsia maris TaxID=72806 RepID=A0ABT1H999_9NOCA|nr:lysozyme [Williamsia maris]MCP2174831.1 LGFP repeat-containing protein [Williamsia maris]
MRIKERMTAVAVAAMAVAMLGSTQVGVASADKDFGEFSVGGRILEAFEATGGVDTWGNPTMNEAAAAYGGRFQRFDNTSFYWKADVSGGVAHQIGGAIRALWSNTKTNGQGYERGPLKYPVSDELAAGTGRKQFLQGGNVYYGANTGTHIVWGQILNKYAAAGGPDKLGLPVGDEYKVGNQFRQDFQKGRVVWP